MIYQRFIIVIVILVASFTNSQLFAASTKSYICDFPSYSDQRGNKKTKNSFRLQFLQDLEAEKAYIMGNNGANPVYVIPNDGGLTFIEITGTGNVMTTVILFTGPSVHSRSGIMLGKIIPSQYYGSCIIK